MTNKQPEALRLADICSKGHSYDVDLGACADELRRQHARITELEEQLSVAQQATEPYAVLVFERGEEGPFDRKPVKPGSVHHLHAKRDPHYDCIELYTHPTQQRMDAIAALQKVRDIAVSALLTGSLDRQDWIDDMDRIADQAKQGEQP